MNALVKAADHLDGEPDARTAWGPHASVRDGPRFAHGRR